MDANTGDLTVSSVIVGTGGLTKTGTGTATLNGANTYSGATTLNAGTLQVGNATGAGTSVITINNGATLGIAGVTIGNNITFNNGGTIQGTGAARSNGIITVAANATVHFETGATATDVLQIGDATNDLVGGNPCTMVVGGSGTVQLNNTSSVTGNWRLDGGILSISTNAQLGANANDLTFNGGTLEVAGTFTMNTGRVFTLNNGVDGTIQVDSGFTLTIGGATNLVTGAGRLVKTGGGTLLLTSSNNYSGGTLVQPSGTTTTVNGVALDNSQLRLSNDTALGTGTLTVNGGTLYGVGAETTLANALNITATSYFTSSNGDDFAFTSNSITGAAGTTVYWVDQTAAVASAHSFIFEGNGFNFASDIFIDDQSRLRFDNNAGTQTFSGNISGGGYQPDLGSMVRGYLAGATGSTVLTGTVNFSGPISVVLGSLEIDGSFSHNGDISVSNGATLALGATASLQMSNGNTITVLGTLQANAGTNWTSNYAHLSSGTGTFNLVIGDGTTGAVDFKFLKIENLSASGIVLNDNTTITQWNHVWFDQGSGGGTGTYITNNKAQAFTLQNTSFGAGYVNYAVTNTTGVTVTINGYASNTSGLDNNTAPGWVGPISARTDSVTTSPDSQISGGGKIAWASPVPTPVKVERFEAKADGDGVLVEWECASELENLGFHIWRRKVGDGGAVVAANGAANNVGAVNYAAYTEAQVKQDGWERVTKGPILGRITNVTAKTYRFFERVTEDGRYEYLLESVSTRGERAFYAHAAQGERTAQALDGAQAQGEAEADVPSKEALAARLDRVERAFAEARDADLSAQRIEARVQALAFGGRADFGFGASRSDGANSSGAGSNAAWPGAGAGRFQGTARVLPAAARTPSGARAGSSSSAAAGAAQVYAVPASALVPQSAALTALRGVSAVGELAQGWTDPAWAYEAVKAVTQERGLVTLPRSALPLGYDPRWLAVTRGGHELALLEATASALSFFAPGYTDEYTDKDAFFLRWKYGARMAVKLPAPQGNLFAQNASGSERATATAAFPEVYFDWGYKPLTYTPWFSAKYLYADAGAGTTQGFNLDLPDLVSGAGELAVLLYSYSEQVGAAPDHKLCAYVNGAYVGETTWTGGNQGLTLRFSVPAAALHAGSNLVELQTPVLPGVDVQFSMLHSLELTYTKALKGRTAIAAQSGKLYEVKGLSAEPWVLDVSAPESPRSVGLQTRKELDGTWTARFVAPANAPLEVLPKNASVPVLRLNKRLIQRLTPGIRYLATGPAQFKSALQPLLQARVLDGLYTVFVDQEKLFDAYGYGRYGPAGIRNAVRDTRPRYLLLVGRTNWDYHGYEGVHLDPLCPTFLVATTRFSQAPSDAAFGDLGGGYPEVAVGRFPVNEVAGLNVCVQRTLAYKGAQSASGQPALLVADRLDPKGIDFAGEADGVEEGVDGFAWTKAYLGRTHETGANVTLQKPEIIDFIRQQASHAAEVVLFVGHGASSVWSNDRILDVPKAAQWTGNCVLLQATCSANYFIHNYPGYYTLVENLLTQPQGGIAASIATTTYLDSPPAVEFMTEVLQASRKPNARWGDALLQAQQYAAKHARGEDSYSDLTRSESLLGDPALKVFGSRPWYKILYRAPGAVSSRAPDGDF
ncbi:MAG: autotransporter-associated beta strand repeat-containing protein [Planctomycetes bacterium]|nr:autotransporter-associated beta strand repeat-containing protein [Planctomycetota bacterium]